MAENDKRTYGDVLHLEIFRGSATTGGTTSAAWHRIGGYTLVGLFIKAVTLGAATEIEVHPQCRFNLDGIDEAFPISAMANPLSTANVTDWVLTLSNTDGVYFPAMMIDPGTDTMAAPIPVEGIGELRVNVIATTGTATDVMVAAALKRH